MKKKIYVILPVIILGMVAVLAILGYVELNKTNDFKFNENTYINGQAVRGYTAKQAEAKVKQDLINQTNGVSIDLYYQDKSWHFDESDLQVDKAVEEVVNTAYHKSVELSKSANALSGGNFKVSFKSVFKNLDDKICDIVKEINQEPVNSEVIFKPNENPMFTVTPSKNGVKVNEEQLYNLLENQFLKEKNIKIHIPVVQVNAEKNESYFEDKLGIMSSFSTDLTNSQAGRKHNVDFALQKFNGKVVKAGETVSFNQVTAPQTLEGGYQKAIVILNGAFTEGVGGGICQASSTLYNACVLANMTIEEVHKHTLPVGYVELSLDAMVSDGYADFIFTNTSENDIYIKTYLKDNRAYAEIYGKSIPDGVTITRDAEIVSKIPHKGDKIVPDTDKLYTNKVIYKGEYYRLKYPKEGYEAKAYKNYYKNGELIKREQIRHEKYQPQDGIVMEGVEDLPEGFTLPESDVQILKPQNQNNVTSNNIAKKIKQQNPTRYALQINII